MKRWQGVLFFILYLIWGLTLCGIGGSFSAAAAAEVETICYTCHTEVELSSGYRTCSVWVQNGHPVYVVPSKKVKIPKEFPLNDKGQIFCGTCHTAGVIDENSTDRQPYIHSRKVFPRQKNINSSICKQCHIQKGGEEGPAIHLEEEDYEYLHEPDVLKAEEETEKNFNHPVDISTKRIPRKIIEYGGNTGTSKNMLICETCHRVHRARDENLLVLDNSNSELCGICHPSTWAEDREAAGSKGTHPVNVVPSTAIVSREVIARGGRVEARGKMICSTCHKVHDAPIKKNLLVIKNDRDAFCIECHSVEERAIKNTKHDLRFSAPAEKNIRQQTAKQSGICSPCHLAHNGRGAKIWAKEIIDSNADAVSQLCQSCHSLFNCAQAKQVGEFSHPVNVALQKISNVRTSLPLFSRGGIQAGIGLVSCATCHDTHRWDPNSLNKTNALHIEGDGTNSFLRQRNLKSSLCYECHSEKRLISQTKHDPRLNGSDQQADVSGLCEECHSVHNANFYMLWNRDIGEGDDNLSRICNSCHTEGKMPPEKLLSGYNHPLNVNILKIGRYITTSLPLFAEDLSRNERGNVLCNTCHDTHRWDPKATRIKDFTKAQPTADTSFLRIAANAPTDSLCDSCHVDKRWIKSSEHDLSLTAPEAKNLQGKTVAQTGVCGACHASHFGSNPFLLWNRKEGPGEDQLTKMCNSCHAKGEIA
jgi:predicted CXXCH cytochrome family protein